MTVITIDNALFSNGLEVAGKVSDQLKLSLLEERRVLERASASFSQPVSEYERLLSGSTRIVDAIVESRPKRVAELRVALAELLEEDDSVLCSNLGYMIPQSVTHVMKVCLAGTRAFRLENAARKGTSEKKAEQLVRRDDESRTEWTDYLLGREPWDKDLFDMVLPLHDLSTDEIVEHIVKNAAKPAVETTDESLAALKDFQLAALVQLRLAEKGQDADVTSDGGVVEISIKKHTLFLNRLQQQLVDIAKAVAGVKDASARPGPRYREAGIYVDFNKLLPTKILLVDDERSFVQTLSKRLKTRDVESEMAYGGAEALDKIKAEEPDVMVLDLKMPGVDGLEVLRNVRANNPRTQVIILTAHGSEAEEELVNQMGAFAYLRKPVDLDDLMETMRAAYAKAKEGVGDNG